VRRLWIAAFALVLVAASSAVVQAPLASSKMIPARASFRVLDVYVDAKAPVAAYQLEVIVARGNSAIVGVEGGERPLDGAPYYDHEAFAKGRIILAAFTTSGALEAGRHRVASVHVREDAGGADYRVSLRVLADGDGVEHRGTAVIIPRQTKGNEQ
jgi:hypothetical protein